MYRLKRLLNPEMYQGPSFKRNYFEGWYYKLISYSLNHIWSIIPGITYDINGHSHAFIQAINGHNGKTYYFDYPASDFSFSKKKFEIVIEKNFFNSEFVELNLRNDEVEISGSLSFHNVVPYPKTLFSPGIMGPFSFIPFMECYHGVVNIHHEIKGSLFIEGNTADFNKGNGYIEKDWGSSFPESWIWLQCNSFSKKEVSLMFSIAKIPFLKNFFTGFLSFITIEKKIYTFATYTGAKIKSLYYYGNIGKVEILIEDRKYKLIISATLGKEGTLKAPKNGLMNRDIFESICSRISVKLYSQNSILIFEGDSHNAGMEIGGDPHYFLSKRS